MNKSLQTALVLGFLICGTTSYAQVAAAPKAAAKPEEAKAQGTLLQRILALEQEARFAEAIQLYEDNMEAAATDPDVNKLKEKASELREEKRTALQLSFAVQQLAADNPQALQAAKDELADGGETGAIYLRKAVREGKGKIATEAVSLLEGLTDANTLATLVSRLKKEPVGPLTPALVKAVGTCIRAADPAGRQAVAKALLPLLPLVQSDPELKNTHIAGLFILSLSQWCNGDAKKFDQYFGGKGLHDLLKNSLKKAVNSTDPAIAGWYGENASLFGLETALMGWWRFDEQNGTIARDFSGRGNNGKINGTAEWVPGVIGTALRFDGKTVSVSLGNPADLQITNSTTVAMWLKPAALGMRQNPYNKAYGGEGTMTVEPDGVIGFFNGTGGADRDPYQTFIMTNALVVNEWAHIAVVRDSKNKKMYWYKNGKLTNEAEATYPSVIASAQEAMIGDGYVEPFNGLIDDVRIYSRALPAQEVLGLHAAGTNQAK